MSCGHCQLKINSELNSSGFQVLNIDMLKNTVTVDAEESDYHKIIRILDNINYLVEENSNPKVLKKYKYWDVTLVDDDKYDNTINYISKLGVEVIGFDEDTCELILMCSKKEYESIVSFTKELSS